MEPIKPEVMADSVIGLSKEEAIAKLNAQGYHARITNQDGKSKAVTADLNPSRVNLHVDNGKVVKAYLG